jgi:hypothetical protein
VRGRGYQPINMAIRLRLEFEFLTAAELSNILTNYQRMLRAAWRETLHDQGVSKSPSVRLVVSGATSGSSPLDMWVEYVLPAVYFTSAIAGPIKDWPGFVKGTFNYVRAVWSATGKSPGDSSSDHIVMTGGSEPKLNIPVSALHAR